MDKWRTRCSTGHVTVLQLLLPEAQDTSGAAASATAAKPMEIQNKKVKQVERKLLFLSRIGGCDSVDDLSRDSNRSQWQQLDNWANAGRSAARLLQALDFGTFTEVSRPPTNISK